MQDAKEAVGGTKLKDIFPAHKYGEHAVDLLMKLLTLNPAKRISAAEALEHVYFWIDPAPQPDELPEITLPSSHEYECKLRREQQHKDAKRGIERGPNNNPHRRHQTSNFRGR